MASLVKATYILEEDREKNRVGPEALAPAWYEPSHFKCRKILKDNHTIFGCIYEFELPLDASAPRFIVAFRGTMLDRKHGLQDGLLDIRVIFGGINKSSRFMTALDAVQELISSAETVDVWIAGHSLGASIATCIGKYMAKRDIRLNTFLFNPPFASIPLDWIPNLDNEVKERVRIRNNIKKFVVSMCMPNQHEKSREEFSKLATWTPYLFVNPKDPISASYIAYFKERKNLGYVEQVATRTSLREICSNVLGLGLEMSHLLPSAKLAVNLKKLSGCRESHGIHQWWQQDISLKFSDYLYQPENNKN